MHWHGRWPISTRLPAPCTVYAAQAAGGAGGGGGGESYMPGAQTFQVGVTVEYELN